MQAGPGLLTIGGQNNYTGVTVVSGGTLQMGGAASAGVTNGLVDYYPFAGNTNDVVGTSNGVINGNGVTVSTQGGKFGSGALYVPGTGGNVQMGSLPSMASGTQARTISAWVQMTAVPANGYNSNIFGFLNYSNNHPNQTDSFYFDNSSSDPNGSGPFFTEYYNDTNPVLSNAQALSGWHMLTAAWDGNVADSIQIYVDGVNTGNPLPATNTQTPPVASNIVDAFGVDTGRPNFEGYLDDLRVYNRALSDADVAQLYAYQPGASLPVSTVLQIGGSGAATVDLNGRSETIAGLSDNGAYANGLITNTSGTAAVLTITPTGGTTTFSGKIQDGAGGIGLVLDGPGTLVLSGTNTYTGGTTVDAGTLVATTSTAIPAGTSLTVAAGGTFTFDPSATGSARSQRPTWRPCPSRAHCSCWR